MPVARTLPPYIHSMVQTGDVRLHVARMEGTEGEPQKPLVLVHGIGMDWRVWQAMSRRLHPHFELFLIDLRGHGRSDKPAHGYTLAHYAADLEDLLERLGLSDALLVGSSLGAMAVLSVEAPAELVSHRILVDPPLTGGPVRDPESFETILRLKHGPVDELARFLAGSYPRSGTALLRIMSEMWHEAADGVIQDMLAQRDTYFDIDSALEANESRTLLLQGDAELGSVVPQREAARAVDRMAKAELLRIAGAGHAIHADRPVEFARAVLEFVARP